MSLFIYTLEESEKWDEVVRSFQHHDVYYLSGYVKAFMLHGDGQPLLFYYKDESIKGINVVMKRDVADDPFFEKKIDHGTIFDFITPYGYGGWLIDGSGTKEDLFQAYETWCRNHGVVSEFVRYHPVLNNAEKTTTSYEVASLGKTILMDLSSPDVIWSNLTSKNRNMIRKAQKSGVQIYHGQFPEIYQTFKSIYNSTMDLNHARSYYYFEDEFYDSICNDLPNEAQVFWADFRGQVIAASIIVEANGYMNYHLSGSLREFQSMAPSNLLLYQASLWGCHNGCRSFHLGGGVGSKEDGLYKFKSAFNRYGTKQFFVGKKVFLEQEYNKLCGMKNITDTELFFPKYRAKI